MEGQMFPQFNLEDHQGKSWTTENFKNTWTILYAYPKDMTSGCTVEAHDFTNNLKTINKLGAQVLGISPDEIKRHIKFCDKEGITFPLLSDPDKNLLQDLEVWVEKSMYGKKYMGVLRSTWIINPEGKIVKEWRKVKVPGHVEEVISQLKELQ